MTASADASATVSPAPRRRWRRRLGVLVLLLVLFVVALVLAAPPLARTLLEGGLEDSLHARAEVGDVELATNGVRLAGLRLDDLEQQRVLDLEGLEIVASPLDALAGRYDVAVDLASVALHLRRTASGGWNVLELPREKPKDTDEPESAPDEAEPLPDVSARVRVASARLLLHGGGETSTLQFSDLTFDLSSLREPAVFSVGGALFGPDGIGAGGLGLSGEVTLSADGTNVAPSGSVELNVDELLLAGLRPLLASLGDVASVDGALSAAIDVAFAPGRLPTGGVDVSVNGLALQALGAERATIGAVSLRGRSRDGADAGQELSLVVGDAVDLSWKGTIDPAGESVLGELTTDLELGPLATLLQPFVPALAERQTGGAVGIAATVGFDAVTGAADVSGALRPRGVTAVGEDGEPLPLEDLEGSELAFAFAGGMDELRVETLRFTGPATLDVALEPLAPSAPWPLVAGVELSVPAAQVEKRLTKSLGLTQPIGLAFGVRAEEGGRASVSGLSLTSELLSGDLAGVLQWADGVLTVEGLEGELDYPRERMGALVSGFVPVDFLSDPPMSSGDGRATPEAESAIGIRWAGVLESFETEALLAASTGSLAIGLDRLGISGLALTGVIDLAVDRGDLALDGSLGANGGGLTVRANLRENEPFGFDLGLSGVGANAEVSSLLAPLHPIFGQLAKADGTDSRGELGGKLDLSVSLRGAEQAVRALIANPSDPAALASLMSSLEGTGDVAMPEIRVQDAPLLELLQRELDDSPSEELRLRPMAFALRDGRIQYDGPWTWTISGAETTFTGSVGLDSSLDLTWNVPVTDDLIDKYRVLRHVKGELLQVPLRGTTSSPKLDFSGALENLAGDALTGGLLEDVLGGGGGKEDPAALLAEADELWAAGKKAEAAELYHRIREDHKLTLVYTLNRKRIKEREPYRE